MSEYHCFIGLELHAQLLTKTKMFCSCKNSFGEEANSLTCPVCLGLPGALPVVNKEAVVQALKFALATSCRINKISYFDRKNYFYPDLPKGYQITQFNRPLARSGFVAIGQGKNIRLSEIHLEEDSARAVHNEDYVKKGLSYLDFNRAGIPLLEIVTKPDIKGAQDTVKFLRNIIKILQYLKISNGKLQDGSLRCDINISVAKAAEKLPHWKIEIKNLNSLNAIKKAIICEKERLISLIDKGEKLVEETRMWNQDCRCTKLLRKKEKHFDYRYFPDPDLPNLNFDDKFLNNIKKEIPELPQQKKTRFQEEYNLASNLADILTKKIEIADFYEKSLEFYRNPILTARVITGEFFAYLNRINKELDQMDFNASYLAEIVELLDKDKINYNIVKKIFNYLKENMQSPKIIVKENNWIIINDKEKLKKLIVEIINSNPDAIKKYKEGDDRLIDFFIGQVMRRTKGRAEGEMVKKILLQQLEEV